MEICSNTCRACLSLSTKLHDSTEYLNISEELVLLADCIKLLTGIAVHN